MLENKLKEILQKELTTKHVYHCINPKLEINIKSKEIFKRSNRINHFPFKPRNGRQKYKCIEKISYEDMPTNLPPGFLKAPKTGYGFTRELSPILFTLQDKFPRLKHIVVSPKRESIIINQTKIVLNLNELEKARIHLGIIQRKYKSEEKNAANNILSGIFPDQFKEEKLSHQPGQLYEYINNKIIRPSKLSEDDLSAISGLLRSLPEDHPFAQKKEILNTKASIDKLLVETLIRQFKTLLKLKTHTKNLEDKWQDYFSEHILYFNFGYIEKFDKELISGDKKINIPDFILLNSFRYLDIFDIKTHLTQLLSFDNGRKNFYWTAEATKAISQAENYVDAIIKEEDTLIKNIRDEYSIHSIDAVRPKAYIIASTRETIAGEETKNKFKGKLQNKLWNDFRRLNNSLINVNFILYDELLENFEIMLKRLGAEAEI